MTDKMRDQRIADILKRLEAVEQKQNPAQPSGLQSPDEIEQEKFQSAVETFNRDEHGMSLNAAPPEKPEDDHTERD